MPNINLKEVYDRISQDYETGLEERKEDKSQGMSALMEAISLFDESYGKGAEKTALANFNQSAVSRGLSGSTRGAAVSTGMKQGFEDMRRGRLGDALKSLAQFLSSFQSGAPNAGNLGYIATGGFGAQSDLEAQRFAQDQASFPATISGNAQGAGYQPPSSRTSFPNPFSRGGNASGSAQVSDAGGAWGSLSTDMATETKQKAPTFAGMSANYGIQGETSLGPEPWSEGAMYSMDEGGWY